MNPKGKLKWSLYSKEIQSMQQQKQREQGLKTRLENKAIKTQTMTQTIYTYLRALYASLIYIRRARVNDQARVLYKTRLILFCINGHVVQQANPRHAIKQRN